MTTAVNNARRRAMTYEREKKMAEQKPPVIRAEVVVFFKPDCAPPNLIPEGYRKGPVLKSFRQSTLQIQAMASETVVTIDEGEDGARHFLHWADIAHIEVVDARIKHLDS